ncbi:MAG: ABC transporter ATP-binding protein [Sulfuritalea sp.]|nr:ABC transporter ATP-binding protein [Sulfuritalea sp.]
MNDVLIKAEGVGKKYCKSLRRGLIYGAEDIARSFFGAEPRSDELGVDEFWSINDVSFEIRRGECLGLIGANGAGKSSLLKMLNGIICPNRGRITVHGKVGALIEIGAGFHPLLSGRENIYVNGAIIGLSRREIERKFDAIVDFSGIEDFIDTPVKHYSSGMFVRLGFAIAVHMEPDILLIDEILAVGDAGFRSKCYNAIGRLSERTAIVFVSHAMPMISRLATETLLINGGRVAFHGSTAEAIGLYHRQFVAQTASSRLGSGDAEIISLCFKDESDLHLAAIPQGATLVAELKITSQQVIQSACVDLVFINVAEDVVAECSMLVSGQSVELSPGRVSTIRARIDSFSLNAGTYKVSALVLSANGMRHYDWRTDFAVIQVTASHVGVAGQQFKAQWEVAEYPETMITP